MPVTTDNTRDSEDATEVENPEAVTDADAVSDAQVAEALGRTTEPAGGRRRWVGAVIAVVIVALLGLSGFLGWLVWQDHRVDQAAQQARAAAASYAQILTSIDADKVDENFDQVLAGATGEFKDMYSQSSMQLRQLLIDNKAAAHGVVVETAVQSATPDTVVVLLFVDQSVTNATVPDPRIDRSRIKMTMQKVDGQWRAANVELP
ncbi:tetratricopeptide repeat protein [Mycolicibacterium bacteremicum]|uniref:tetratricopeptide repeat protein n=1 Tax=Mycolicibacterium bacteremicum TaxID=564198 RepID=UPI0026F0EB43|nr:tetratricopeptide repeat protein [Mycolicibacterium bacteremicum]